MAELSFESGQVIGDRYRLESKLGEGGMGVVYAASDAEGSQVAIKVLHPEFGRDSHTRERFLREGAVANRVDHAGVVRVLDHGVAEDGLTYIVMEKLEGQSLRELIADSGRMALPDVLDVLDQVLDVLSRAHDIGIVHRDLKPDNLFVQSDDMVKVLDFGVARILDDDSGGQRTKTGVAVGTVAYMAPEQAMGRRSQVDGRADLFALGATAFRALTGRRVHEAPSAPALLVAMATEPAPPLTSVAPHIPEPVARVIDTALAFDRDARYPDARTMRTDVQSLQRGERPPFASARAEVLDAPTQAHRVATVPSVAAVGSASSDGARPGQVASAEAPALPEPRRKLRWVPIALGAVALAALGWAFVPTGSESSAEPVPDEEEMGRAEQESDAAQRKAERELERELRRESKKDRKKKHRKK